MRKKLVVALVLLCAVLSMTLFACVPQNETTVDTEEVPVEIRDNKIAVISDIHLYAEEKLTSQEDVEYVCDRDNKLVVFGKAAFLTLIDEIIERGDIKNVLIPGDLSAYGSRCEHVEMAECLKKLEAGGINAYIINGNHDIMYGSYIYAHDFLLDDFKETYADFGYSEAISVHEESASYSANVGDIRLIALDNNSYAVDLNYESMHNYPDATIMTWLTAELERAKADNKEVVVMYHQPYQAQFVNNLHAGVGNYYTEMMNLLTQYGVKLTLCGHNHGQLIADVTTEYGSLNEVMTSSLVFVAPHYRVLDFYEDSVEIKSYKMEKINAKYLKDGIYTDEQIAAVTTDYYSCVNEHAYDILESSKLKAYIRTYLAKIPLIKNAFLSIVKKPIYEKDGDNSLESFVKSYGGSIPETEYKYVYNLAHFYLGAMCSGYRASAIDCSENIISKYVVYALLYKMQTTLNESLPEGSEIDIDFEKLFTTGELEAIDSNFINGLIKYIDSLEIISSLDLSKFNFTTLDAITYLAPSLDSLILPEMKIFTAMKPYIGTMSFNMDEIFDNVVFGKLLGSMFADDTGSNHNNIVLPFGTQEVVEQAEESEN